MITLGELELGVLNAPDASTRAQRGDTLALDRAADPFPVSESMMSAWRGWSRTAAAQITRTVKLLDALIAATATDLGLPVVTQNADFDQMARAHQPLAVIAV